MHSTLEVIESTDGLFFDLVDLATLKVALGITSTTEDVALSASITRWSKVIAEDIERVLALQDVRETFRFDKHRHAGHPHHHRETSLILARAPIAAINSIQIDGNAIDLADVDVDSEVGQIWIRNHSWWMCKTVVFYAAGYSLPDAAPAKLQQACIQAVRDARLWTANSGTSQAVQRLAHGDSDVRFFEPPNQAGLSSGVLDLIQPFRRLLL